MSSYRNKVKDDIAEINNKLYEDANTDDPHAFRYEDFMNIFLLLTETLLIVITVSLKY